MKVLVTGATGFIGARLLPILSECGHTVVGVTRQRDHVPRDSTAAWVVCDLTSPDAFDLLPSQVDAVVHLAQANAPFPAGAGELFAVNVATTASLLGHAVAAGAHRFVLASSGTVYGPMEAPAREDDVPRGRDFYSATKLAAERLVCAYDDLLTTSILRIFTPYGEGQVGRIVSTLVAHVAAGTPVTLHEGGRPRLSPIYVGDLVDVVAETLSCDERHFVNLGGPEALTIRELAEQIGDVLGRPPVFANSSEPAAGDFVADTTRFQSTFASAQRLTPFAVGVEGLARALATERAR